MAPVEPQVELIMDIAPDTKKLGVIYIAGEVKSVVQISMLKDIAGNFFLSRHPLARTINLGIRSSLGEI